MANWYGASKTNWFAVKDVETFVDVVDSMDGTESGIYCSKDGNKVCLSVYDDWPTWINHEDGSEEEVDFLGTLAKHLEDGEVIVSETIGNEKLRYLTGYASAINNKGERIDISLYDIYERAKELCGAGVEIKNAVDCSKSKEG